MRILIKLNATERGGPNITQVLEHYNVVPKWRFWPWKKCARDMTFPFQTENIFFKEAVKMSR